jgi:adenylate cyclase
MERRLTAIVAADVANYSRLVGDNEEDTLAALKAHRNAFIDPTVHEHRGRIVKTMGDGLLVEFASAVDAVRCAVEIQRGMGERNAGIPDDRQITFRIGVNVGDIVVEDGDIFGDGVNVAARLQALADPGNVLASGSAYEHVRDKLGFTFEDIGEHTVKNIARPVQIYRVFSDSAAQRASPRMATLPLPDKPSIAVLPFANMSDDPEQEYFAAGMAEEIITALSRCHSLFVIARNSSFAYKGKSVDVRQVGRELGVRYVLEGSVRRSGNRLRFISQLIVAASGTHIWADRFEGEISDVFALQDRFSESVVATIEPRLQLAEIERLKHKPVGNLNAYDLLLRAQQSIYDWTAESVETAMRSLEKALAIDPNYAPALATLANCYATRRFQGWGKDYKAEAIEGLRLAARAIEFGKDDGEVLWRAANAIWHLGMDIQRATELIYRALDVNPNSSIALTIAGWIETASGNPEKALELFDRAQRLSPRDVRGWTIAGGMAFAHYRLGDLEKAVTYAQKALADNPRSSGALWVLAAAFGKMGEKEKAAAALAEVLKIEPGLTLSRLRARTMYTRKDVWLKLGDGLRLAGMAE